MTPSVVAVTGGSGFIGSHLIRRLTRQGMQVRALSRRPPTASGDARPSPVRDVRFQSGRVSAASGYRAAPEGVEWITGDVNQRSELDRLMEGASVVYHLAGCVKPWARDPGEFERVNADGTAAVCEAAQRAGVRVLVHTSTNLVEEEPAPASGIQGRNVLVDETTDRLTTTQARRRTLTAYQRSKIHAEEYARAAAASGSLRVVIVRPTRVYGPGPMNEANSATHVVMMYWRGFFRLRPADAGARANYVYVKDLVRGMILAAERGESGAAYTLGGASVMFSEFLAAVDAAAGTRPRRTLPIPPFVFKSAAAGLGLLGALSFRIPSHLGVSFTPPITREWGELLTLDWPSSSDRAQRDLGYRPRSLDAGLKRTLRWLERGAKW